MYKQRLSLILINFGLKTRTVPFLQESPPPCSWTDGVIGVQKKRFGYFWGKNQGAILIPCHNIAMAAKIARLKLPIVMT